MKFISLSYAFIGKEGHVLSKTFMLHSRAIAIEVAVVMFKSPSGCDCNRFPRIWMSAFCVMLAMWVPNR